MSCLTVAESWFISSLGHGLGLKALGSVGFSFDGLDEEGLHIGGSVEHDPLHVLLQQLLDGMSLGVRADVFDDLLTPFHGIEPQNYVKYHGKGNAGATGLRYSSSHPLNYDDTGAACLTPIIMYDLQQHLSNGTIT